MTVAKLASWIAAEMVSDQEGETYLDLSREWTFDESLGLRQKTVDELITLHGRLCRAIPDDFDFYLSFHDGKVSATLDYVDGPHAGYGCHFPVPLDRNMLNALREYDWNGLRSEIIQGTQLHDNAADLAKNYPSMLEPMAVIQERHAQIIAQFGTDPDLPDSSYALLYGHPLEDEYEDEDLDEEEDEPDEIDDLLASVLDYEVIVLEIRKRLLGEIGDLLTCGHTLIAIRHDGKLLSAADTEALRQEALEGLGPISRAKAEGRFASALEAILH